MLDALIVAPHPDDAELGMGGTIVRLMQQGWKLGILDLTSGEPTPLGTPRGTSVRDGLLPRSRHRPTPWRQNLGLPNRSLEAVSCSTAELSRPFSAQVRPRLLFAPYWEDAHPDHTRGDPSLSRMPGSGAS